MSDSYILAIDQGTSSTKVIIFDENGLVVKKATAGLKTTYHPNGHVEQSPQDILNSVENACRECLQGFAAESIRCIGISNQRETFVLWDKNGKPVYPAIVWACKRSTGICGELKAEEPWLREKTGLVADPYFSGTKLLWILENEPELAARIRQGDICFGTIDTWLLFKLTGGSSYYTDHSNASRTLFFNLRELSWDDEILRKWGLQSLRLPSIKSSSEIFGETDLFGQLNNKVPVTAMIGDSHAAMFGEHCFEPGTTKMTLGTGCSLLMHIGDQPRASAEGLLCTIGWSTKNQVAYAWEGAIVACGSMVEWLKSLHIIDHAGETDKLAMSVKEPSELYLIPAFSGLGAPFWEMTLKASFHGISFGTTAAHLVKATLESICFQIKAVVDAMQKDLQQPIAQIAMHGGLSKNIFVQQGLVSLIDSRIDLQDNADISAQGAAFLAGLQTGIFEDLEHIASLKSTQHLSDFKEREQLTAKYQKWLALINNTITE